jgi:hypothetical protein
MLQVIVLVLALFPSLACAQARDADALRQFGMQGHLAIECSKPQSKTNPHVVYGISAQGQVTRTLRMGPDAGGTFPMRNLRLLRPNLLQYDETGRRSEEFTVTIAKIDGKFRSWHSVQANGTVLINEGKFSGSGSPTPAFAKCVR